MLRQREPLRNMSAIQLQNRIPDVQNQEQLDQWKRQVSEKLTQLNTFFDQGRDHLSKIRLGWFSSNQDASRLRRAKELIRRGYDATLTLKLKIHQALRDLNIEHYRLIQAAVQKGQPIQKSWHKVFLIIAGIGEVAVYIFNYFVVPLFLPGWTIGVAAIALIGTVIYELKKRSNHRELIEKYLQVQPEIERLEGLIDI